MSKKIIAILLVIVLGAAGFLIWMNQSQKSVEKTHKKPVSSPKSNPSPIPSSSPVTYQTDDVDTVDFDALFKKEPVTFTINLPKSWSELDIQDLPGFENMNATDRMKILAENPIALDDEQTEIVNKIKDTIKQMDDAYLSKDYKTYLNLIYLSRREAVGVYKASFIQKGYLIEKTNAFYPQYVDVKNHTVLGITFKTQSVADNAKAPETTCYVSFYKLGAGDKWKEYHLVPFDSEE
jgi:hypothetical protein